MRSPRSLARTWADAPRIKPAPTGTTVLGTATLINGVAVFKTAKLSKGTHNLTAVFGGDANYAGSTSAALVVTIN
jgi:hypothetical protein